MEIKIEIINEFKDTNRFSDGLEIKNNEIICYQIRTVPNSLVFYDLNKNEKIKTLNNLNLWTDCVGYRIIKLNNDEVAVAGNGKVYLIDINNYLILNEINSDCLNRCILKLSNNLFLIGDLNGTITQYKIGNKKIIKESFKLESHGFINSMTLLNEMIITGGEGNNEIKIWK